VINPNRTGRGGLPRTLFFTAVAFAGGAMVTHASATSREESPYAAMGQLGRVLVMIENEYVEPVERAKMVNGAIEGMVAGLDPHSSYMPPQDFSLFESDTQGQFGGVGIEVDARGEMLTVIAPIEGSPAERAGVRSGDKLLAVDGEMAQGIALDKMVRRMRGAPGSHVKLTLRREGAKEPIVFDLVREVIRVPSVSSRLLEGGVAYVRVKQFQERTHDEFLRAVARMRGEAKPRLTGVVLDLRSDPGGLVDEAAEVADEFLDSGVIYSARHRGKVVDEVRARSGGSLLDIPAVVLVNEWSASASELVTGALQDHKRAVVVGASTFGKGSVQTIFELPGGAGMRLTTERYYTPDGHAIQAVGVRPDVIVEGTRATEAALPTVRESDLEGHLSAEGVARNAPRTIADAGPPVDAAAPDASALLASEGTLARVATNPEQGNDYALRVGYRIVRANAK
jgi:carboxyl-terminal processing protease